MGSSPARLVLFFYFLVLLCANPARGETFRVATYNLENYLDEPTQTRVAKSPEARAKIRENIRALAADVIALEEVGSPSALQELRGSLKNDGADFPYWEIVNGFDTNIHVAVLSKFPFTARRPHTNDNFLLNGRRFRVSRGFPELDVQVNQNYSFTLIAAHLKSKRAVGVADETELRLEEAKILRQIIDTRLATNPGLNLVVLGDLNDTRDSMSTKTVIGKGKNKLMDTRPAERHADATGEPISVEARNVTWTHFFAKEDTYSRIDYILLSSGMAREWMQKETYVLAAPGWGIGSDHRPLVAAFEASEK
jgi:endonuclease/exonuclease/phosphatase family metal-dependent hydrolase